MLYKIAHFLREKLGWLWIIIEWANGLVFSLRYGKKLKSFSFTNIPFGYDLLTMRELVTEKLVDFFAHQPEEAFTYFHPHGFDEKSLKRLQRLFLVSYCWISRITRLLDIASTAASSTAKVSVAGWLISTTDVKDLARR